MRQEHVAQRRVVHLLPGGLALGCLAWLRELFGGEIQFDCNSMSPNKFGDIGMSTRVYYFPQPATYTLLDTESDERLFSVTMPGYSGAKLRLVVFGDPAKPSGGRLLELDDHDVIQNIHWLQAAPQH